MSNDSEFLKKLLIEQKEFAQNLLEQQNKWMKALLEKQADGITSGTTSTIVPSFPKFSKDQQTWESYLEQLNQHFSAYGVNCAEKKKSFFLSWIGAEVFELLKNLFGSTKLQEQTFKELTEKLTEHFQSSDTSSQHVTIFSNGT